MATRVAARMRRDEKLARQKKAARELAEIFYASLRKFPKKEQKKKIREFSKITSRLRTRAT